MSAENVEAVRAAWDAWDADDLGAVAAHWDPDIEWRAIQGAPDDAGPIQGAEALRTYYQDWIDTFDELDNEMVEMIDIGGDNVVTVQRGTGVAKGSRVPTEIVYAVVYTVRDGLIVSGREYATREQALEAADVAETT
jgi:ketosteroid isomerase-like protein